ncbi:methyltransferase [Amycolatopsis sp. NPDC059021]|uniref:methyltransferase n=1 Tax=Amycolatopsis sp. NPDC059021 TaxID=3346704 RepID=UPI00366FD2A4
MDDFEAERTRRRVEELFRHNAEDPDRQGSFTLFEKEWVLLDGVFSPAVTPATRIFTSWLPYPADGRFLEIGPGAGVTAVTAAHSGCASVTAVDISRAAVENTRRNAELHGVAGIVTARHGDLFDALDESDRFDLIFWNSNFVETAPDAVNETELHHAFYDPGFRAHRRFLAEAPGRLAPAGRLLLGFSDIGSWKSLRSLCSELGLAIEVLRTERLDLDDPVSLQLLELHPA